MRVGVLHDTEQAYLQVGVLNNREQMYVCMGVLHDGELAYLWVGELHDREQGAGGCISGDQPEAVLHEEGRQQGQHLLAAQAEQDAALLHHHILLPSPGN